MKTRDVPESTNSTVCVQFSANFSTDFNINVLPATPVNATAIGNRGTGLGLAGAIGLGLA